jgi:SAM-dependent methyltransferase
MAATARLIRFCRALTRRWSPDRDRAFHDAAFAGQRHEPFTFAYPGYLTIRRFADLASPRLEGAASALDLGCGTAEITCELARRHPTVSLVGVDHSRSAIDRAQANARALGLANIRFETSDMARHEPRRPVDLVLMFDAFHHADAPADLVRRLGAWTSGFLLVEPHGDWKGSWRRDIDCDWLVLELEKIRARVALTIREEDPGGHAGAPEEPTGGEPTEHRYGLDEFERFFAGYGLDVRGTVAGLCQYPASPRSQAATREWFGRVGYEMLKEVDDRLRARDLDLLAKHWVIYAKRGATFPRRRVPAGRAPGENARLVQGPYDAEYVAYSGPRVLAAGAEAVASLTLRNRSWNAWTSDGGGRVFASYHWLDRRRKIVVRDGVRSPLPRPLAPGDECGVAIRLRAPDRPGRYLLALDLVDEGTAWFSDAGVPCLLVPFRVSRGGRSAAPLRNQGGRSGGC